MNKMPKRVLIIGLLFCLSGILAIWDVLSGICQNRLSLNFAVLLLPVGIGLLRGRQRSQWWARFCIISEKANQFFRSDSTPDSPAPTA